MKYTELKELKRVYNYYVYINLCSFPLNNIFWINKLKFVRLCIHWSSACAGLLILTALMSLSSSIRSTCPIKTTHQHTVNTVSVFLLIFFFPVTGGLIWKHLKLYQFSERRTLINNCNPLMLIYLMYCFCMH